MSTPADHHPNRIGPYQIVELLGTGGMGDVYLGKHSDTGAEAAVKVLTASLARETGFVDRFYREIDAMRKLDNPFIVKLYDAGRDGERYYYAMEYVAGETLMSVMRRERRIPWSRTFEIAIQICQALKAAHDNGIIHRDLKPSNLMITANGSIMLTDFGVAQVFASNRLTVTGGIVGTAEYMSPEQAQGKRASKQSDLYSLGAVMYTMITGRTPFTGSTAIEVIQKHKFGLFDRPGLIVPDLPQRVEDTICRLLEKDPAKRFPDARVLLRHMEQVIRLDEFAKAGVTLTGIEDVDVDDSTVAATLESAGKSVAPTGPGPATIMSGLMRAELSQAGKGGAVSALFNNLYVLVALLALVIAGGYWWMQSKTLSPQELFDRGVALLQQPAGPEWIRARREYFEPLLAQDANAWREQVEPYLREIDVYELSRPKSGRPRLRGRDTPSEPERLLQLALHYRQVGELGRAERTLVVLGTLVSGVTEYDKTLVAAQQLLEEIRQARTGANDRQRLIEAALERATQLETAGHPAEAVEIWSAIVTLYDAEPGAEASVAQARAALAKEHSGDRTP